MSNPMHSKQDAEHFGHGCIFWGKFVADGPRCLPLAAHCLDVALVFRHLCNLPAIRRTLQHAASGDSLSDTQLDRLAMVALWHDIGKANLGFQYKVFRNDAPKAGHIRELEPLFDDDSLHATLLASLPEQLATWFPDGEVAYSYLLASFSHHGRPLVFKGERTGTYSLARRHWWKPDGPYDPMAAIAEITRWGRRAFPDAFAKEEQPLPAEPQFHHRFAGLVMLADWLASHSYWFPVKTTTLQERLQHGKQTIPRMFEAIGLDVGRFRPALSAMPNFASRFPFSPRPLQAAIDRLSPEDDNTRLVIAESETGSGKTEAALNWFFKLLQAGKVDSLYFALPTRVAARELYERVNTTIARWFPDESLRPVTVLAVPGYAAVDGVSPKRLLPDTDEGNFWHDDTAMRRRERQWAAEHPKRFLAATVAVGTIDQALLSSVQTAHAHLRSICLDRSLLVVDEVHASDVYMTRLLKSLLNHHLHIGGRALLLSATLGAAARHEFVGKDLTNVPDFATATNVPYPSLTLSDGTVKGTRDSTRQPKQVEFELAPIMNDTKALARRIVTALYDGARVIVVMNTVARANQLLRFVESETDIDSDWIFQCRNVVCPHHGRFAPVDRGVLDGQVSLRLGPDSAAGPLLLIGTQTLEQSLDIDADLMITDLAPADVLLQRVGRLHRHERSRPTGYEQPRCIVLTPKEPLEEILDERGHVRPGFAQMGFGSVYEDARILQLTIDALKERPAIEIPLHNRWLVESATHPQRLAAFAGRRWVHHGQKIDGGELAQAIAAGHAAVVFDQYFGQCEFNEAGGKVMTRLGADSLQLPIDKPFISPFGERVKQIVIPGHMAPTDPVERVVVKKVDDESATLRCGEQTYKYSRYGLEVIK